MAREAAIAVSASSASSTPAPPRATAMTSASVSGPTPTRTRSIAQLCPRHLGGGYRRAVLSEIPDPRPRPARKCGRYRRAMRAVVITEPGGPEVLQVQDVPAPTAGPGEVIIDVAATAINRADLLQRQGNYPPPHGASPYPGME